MLPETVYQIRQQCYLLLQPDYTRHRNVDISKIWFTPKCGGGLWKDTCGGELQNQDHARGVRGWLFPQQSSPNIWHRPRQLYLPHMLVADL